MRLHQSLFPLLAILGLASPAGATVDALIPATVIVRNVQTEGYCYLQIPVAAEVGIPIGEMIAASLSPHWALRNRTTAGGFAELTTIKGQSYVNLNEISLGARIKHSYILDEYKGTTFIYRGQLDVSELATKNGSTTAGRRATIRQAKLALLAIAKDMALAAGSGSWQLHLGFKGLPSQSGLSGTPLYATTSWPYTTGSPLLAKYGAELIHQAGCGSLGGKADELGSVEAPLEESAGCTTGGAAPTGVAALGGLLVLGLLLGWRRRS
jgi:MYXO-CTERM domain-containing protein